MAPMPVSFKNSLRFIRAAPFLLPLQFIDHVVDAGELFLHLMQSCHELAPVTPKKADARGIIRQRYQLAPAGICLADSLMTSSLH